MRYIRPAFHSVEQCDDPDELKRVALNYLSKSTFLHGSLRVAFGELGFDVRRVEKLWFHEMWQVRLGADRVLCGCEAEVTKCLRGALRRHRLPADPDTLTVRIDGSHVRVAFAMPGGELGAGWA